MPTLVTTSASVLLIIGTFQDGPGLGLSTARFDTSHGTLTPPILAAEAPVPGFLTIAPDGRHVHVTQETLPGRVGTFAIDATAGTLTRVADVASPSGWPCHIALDHTARVALVAHYHDGAFSTFALDDEGRLSHPVSRLITPGRSVRDDRQTQTHAHALLTDPTNRFALGVDLGADRVHVFRFDADGGTLARHEPAFFSAQPGAGPRHLRFHPDGRHAYIVNELDCTVSACTWDAERGVLTEFQRISSLPAEFSGENTSAEIMVHPDGRTLYVSNRGLDAIATFAIDPATRALTLLEQTPTRGARPRNFVIDPTARWLLAANQDGDSIAIFAIAPTDGRLTAHGEPIAVKNPACLRFVTSPVD